MTGPANSDDCSEGLEHLESLTLDERERALLNEARRTVAEHERMKLSGLDPVTVIAPIARRAARLFDLWATSVEHLALIDVERRQVAAEQAEERRQAEREALLAAREDLARRDAERALRDAEEAERGLPEVLEDGTAVIVRRIRSKRAGF